ncbi:MAG: flagellar basal body-associated protein FliL [Clostridiales bacterium]|nr:flagellar basal body-associated protein FliL [Clostridiales bacterium]
MSENNVANEPGKKMNPLVIIILLLVVVGAGTFGGVYLFMQKNNTGEVTEEKVPILEAATVNLNDESGKKYVKASVYISYDKKNSDLAEEITNKTVEIKDKTIFYLKSKSSEDFTSDNEETIKKELVSEINKLLKKGSIINVYFPGDLLVQ